MRYFETIKCYDESIFNLYYHQKRIAKTVGLNINLQDYIYPPSSQLLKCKVIYDKSGILDILFSPNTPKEVNSFKLIFDDTINYKYKSTNRDYINNLFNQKENADEIIIIKNGLVTDTSIANIAIYDGVNWLTPKSPLLEGTTRARLFEEKFLIEKDITKDDLLNSQKVALMNAMLGFKIIDNISIYS